MSNEELFYTYGPDGLLGARESIRTASFLAAKARAEAQDIKGPSTSEVSSRWESANAISHSQVGDSRPLSSIAICPDQQRLAVSGFSGDVNTFSLRNRDMNRSKSLRGHTDRCCGLSWNPFSNGVDLASAGADGKIMLWKLDQEPEILGPHSQLIGHELRVNRVVFHPKVQNLIASTSDDETWRLWDIEHQQELLLQEGHAGGVIGLAVHPDGSLLASSDTVGVIRVWDLRSGRSIMSFEGHAEQVVGLDISPNGYSMASCSGDNSVRVWDLRKSICAEVLTWHDKLVSSVKFDRDRGDLLMTAGYDCVARVCRTSDFKILKNFPIHESRIMGADLASDGSFLVTACYDRTFKVWETDGAVREKDESMKLE
jgi:U4/U6 small nuclear ribonucleoprotein PRP4